MIWRTQRKKRSPQLRPQIPSPRSQIPNKIPKSKNGGRCKTTRPRGPNISTRGIGASIRKTVAEDYQQCRGRSTIGPRVWFGRCKLDRSGRSAQQKGFSNASEDLSKRGKRKSVVPTISRYRLNERQWSRCVDCRGSRISAYLFADHFEKRVMTPCFLDFGILPGVWGLRFGTS